jgi:hypothetical protein
MIILVTVISLFNIVKPEPLNDHLMLWIWLLNYGKNGK